MIGGGGGASFQNIQVLLTANNTNLKSVLTQSSAGIKAFDKTVTQSNVNLGKSGNLLGKTLAGGAMVAAAGLAYAAGQAIEFDKAMRNVNSLAGLGEEAFSSLEQRVISMSTRLPQSATTLAEGLYDIQSSGFAGADGMKVLEASALSASAGLTTTEVSAKAISAVLNSYGLQAKDAADVSDVLFQTVNAGVISFDELAGNLGDVVGGAAAAKVEIDEVGSAIAAMTLAGIGGAESTTSLNALLQKLIQPSRALVDVYAELGYESGAQALEADGLRGVMEKLRVATGGNITTLLELFPEIRAARGALALMANEGENYARTAAQIEDKNKRAGAAQRVFNEQMKAASNQAALLKNQVDATAIQVGLRLIPVLLQGMEGLRDMGSAIGDVVSLLGSEFGPGLADLGSILGDVWSTLVTVGTALWALVEPVASIGVGALAEGFNLLMGAVEPVTGLLADNEAAVVALAVALTIYLMGGVKAAASAVGYNLVLALVQALTAVESFSAGLGAARAAMAGFIASAGPLIAVAAAVYMAVGGWQAYSKAVEETGDALESVDKAQRSGTVSGLRQEVDELNKLVAERKKAIDEYGSRDLGTILKNLSPMRWDDQFAIEEYKDSISTLEEGAQTGEEALSNFAAGVAALADKMGMIDTAEAERLVQAFAEGDPNALQELDSLLGEMQPKLAEAGISARVLQQQLQAVSFNEDGSLNTAALDGVIAALEGVNSTGESTASSQEKVREAFLSASEGAVEASDAADSLKEALDELTGAAMGVDEAGINWRQGLADLTSELQKTGGGIQGNSLEAGKNRLAIQDQVGALQDLLVAQARNGAGAQQLSRTLANSREALIAAGRAAHVPASAMRALLRQYKLTPALVQTLIKEHGGKDVQAMLKRLQREADKTDAKKPKIGVGVLTEKGERALKEMQRQSDILGLKKPKVRPEAPTDKAKRNLEELGKTADKTDKKKADIPTSAPGATAAESQIRQAGAAADAVDGKRVIITTEHRSIRTGKQADGGYYPFGQFADGGFSANVLTSTSAKLPGQAQIQPGAGQGLVQWAEGETGGEAFIPLGPGKRARSTAILEQVAAQFGYQLAEMESFAGGGFRGRKKGESPSEYARARQDHADDRREKEKERRERAWERAQERRERQRLSRVIHGHGAGRYRADVTGDPQKSMANLDTAMEARAQARAELAARRSKNPNDSAEDFYKKPVVGVREYTKALGAARRAAVDWGEDTSRISKKVGSDVVLSLQGMGEDGEKWIKKLADASVKDMKAMAAELRKIQYVEFQNGLTQDIAAQKQFAGNLAALIRMGRGDLAAQFAEMGYQNAGGLAAQAVTMNAGQLGELAGQMAQQDALGDPAMMDAVNLAGVLQSSQRVLGILGLSTASGKSVGDVVGLLTRYNKDVFSQMPADRMAQIRADQELLRQGKQPSGLEYGGIVPGSKTSDSLYYRWAEKGSGGESLIPLGQDRRQRAISIWEQTGRILGTHSTRGGGGSMVVVQPGAVVVDIDASGQNMTRGELESIARAASNEAMASLANKIRTGKR